MPLVSVILPNYNYARYLPLRIESILNQTFTDFELIILDDASSDNSLEVIEQYKNRDQRIRLIANTVNSGNTFIQWQKGITEAKGTYIWIAEADDFCEPDLIENLLPAFDDTETIISFCQSKITNSKGDTIKKWGYTNAEITNLFTKNQLFNGKQLIAKALVHENVLPNASAVIFRKSIYEKVGGVDVVLKSNADWLFWLSAACYGKISFYSEALNYFRRHDQSVIAKNNSNTGEYHERYDQTLRNKFIAFIRSKNIALDKNTLKINKTLIAYDEGNKALFHLRKKQFFKAFVLLIKTSCYLKSMGFIKKAMSNA
ncbi:glycosyltransferase [Winogradskyella sp.]|nr:glycosyltransferase [Winogradskyella sp.]